MRVNISKIIEIPANLFCDGCQLLKSDMSGKRYCNEYGPFLEQDNMERTIKCEKCLLNLRKNMIGEV